MSYVLSDLLDMFRAAREVVESRRMYQDKACCCEMPYRKIKKS